jgi:ER membrane protein complex subunit 4
MWTLNLDRSKENLIDPIGFRTVSADNEESKKREKNLKEMKQSKAWEASNRPIQSMFSTFLMLFMSGSGLNFISIIITCMAMWTPIKAFITVNSVFAQFEGEGVSLILPKLKYLALNVIVMIAGVYKLSVMGLLPFNAEDWISLVPISHPVEISDGFFRYS